MMTAPRRAMLAVDHDAPNCVAWACFFSVPGCDHEWRACRGSNEMRGTWPMLVPPRPSEWSSKGFHAGTVSARGSEVDLLRQRKH